MKNRQKLNFVRNGNLLVRIRIYATTYSVIKMFFNESRELYYRYVIQCTPALRCCTWLTDFKQGKHSSTTYGLIPKI